MKSLFTSGRPSNPAAKTIGVLRYLPSPRSPAQPSVTRRENIMPADLKNLWDRGRMRNSMNRAEGGYATEPSRKYFDEAVSLIPKHELEKFMPNISLGKQAHVTPVSLMSARSGQRVTHDMIHSYDPYIGQLERDKPATVDHDAVSPQDEQRVGLHGDTLGCRWRIYRWLRRAPQSQEEHYMRRTIFTPGNKGLRESESERPLARRVVRLAKSGQLKAACEAYRRFTLAPPLEVYRALMAACVPGAMLADAISIFEDGFRLWMLTRDAEVFTSLMKVAVRADNPERVMWCYNLVRGTHSENNIVHTAIEPHVQHRIAVIALEYLLDSGHASEARTVYHFLATSQLLEQDVHEALGAALRAKLAKGEKVSFDPAGDVGAHELSQDASQAATIVAEAWRKQLPEHEAAGFGAATPALDAFRRGYSDVDVSFVLRTARFEGRVDLLGTGKVAQYTERVLAWLDVLSDRRTRAGAPLPYLLKSTPSRANSNLRVALPPRATHDKRRLLPSDIDGRFAFSPETVFVQETYPSLNTDSHESRYLARQPVQRPVPGAIADYAVHERLAAGPRARSVHTSVRPDAGLVSAPTPRLDTTGDAAGDAATGAVPSTKNMTFDESDAAKPLKR